MGDQNFAAIVFWLVIFGMAAFGIWAQMARERERQQTIRAAIERGQQLDPSVLDKVMARPAWYEKPEGGQQTWQQLMIGGIIVSFIGGGLAVFAFFLSHVAPKAFWPLLGGAAIVGMTGLGLLVAAAALYKTARISDARAS